MRESKRKLFKLEKPEDPSQAITNPYFDPRMGPKAAARAPKMMKFHERGKFVELAQKQRAKNKLEELQKKVAETAKKTGISTVAKRIMLTQDDNSVSFNTFEKSSSSRVMCFYVVNCMYVANLPSTDCRGCTGGRVVGQVHLDMREVSQLVISKSLLLSAFFCQALTNEIIVKYSL